MLEKLKKYLGGAAMHSLMTIVYWLFIVPFALWVKAIERLAIQRETGALSIEKSQSKWPFLSFLKVLCLEFSFDFNIFLVYPIGILVSFFGAIIVAINGGFLAGFGFGIAALIVAYYLPVGISIMRDFTQLFFLLVTKVVSWLRKPAQHLDLKVKG